MADFPRFDLAGQTALVTGAARGLGRAISLALANAGANVMLGLRNPASGSHGDLVEEIRSMGHGVDVVACDIRDLGQVRSAVDRTVAAFGRLDILVNNAGLGPENPAEDVTEDDFDLTHCAAPIQARMRPHIILDKAQPNFLDPAGDGRVVMGQVFNASKGLLDW